MLIATRNAMTTGGGGSPLPSEYQPVEYLRSEGRTQYITLGNATPSKVDFEIRAAIYNFGETTTRGRYVVGVGNIYSGYRFGGLAMGYPYSNLAFNGDSSVVLGSISEGEPIDILYKDGVIKMLPDGQEKSVLWRSDVSDNRYLRLFLFSVGGNEAIDAAIYRAKFWVDGTLTWDVRPCYRKADNVAGYYNLVDGTFYTNSGTGAFAIGPDKSAANGGGVNA